MKIRKFLAAMLSAAMAATAFASSLPVNAVNDTPTAAVSEEKYSVYAVSYPYKNVFGVGEKLDVYGGMMSVNVTDANGICTDRSLYSLDDPLFEVQSDDFTEPGEYTVNIIYTPTGERVSWYNVTVVSERIVKTGKYSRSFSLVDKDTGENIEGLECELIDVINDTVVYSWETTGEPEALINGLNYQFDDQLSEDSYLYALRINNLSEKNYRYTGIGGFCGLNDETGMTYYRLSSADNANGVPEDTVIKNTVKLLDTSIPREPVKSSTTRYTGTYPKYTTTTTSTTTTAVTDDYTYYFLPNAVPQKKEYCIGETLDVHDGVMTVSIEDSEGNFVDFYHLPFSSSMFEIKHDPFDEPGVYAVDIFRKATGERIFSYNVTVTDDIKTYYTEAGKCKLVCVTESPRSSCPIDFEVMGFDKEERDWSVSFKGNYSSSCKVTNYYGSNRFTVNNDSGGDITVVVIFSDRSVLKTTVRVANSTTRPPVPGTTTTTTTVGPEYPKSGTYTEVISFIDAESGRPIKGLKCELIDNNTERTIYKWNTTDEPSAEIDGLYYLFEKPQYNSITYILKINNMNDKYKFTYNESYRSLPPVSINGYGDACYLTYTENMADNGMNTVNQVIALKSVMTYTFRWTTPPIMEYSVGDELNVSQGLIQYYVADANGEMVDYGHVPLYQLKTEHEPFTAPGDYEVKVYRQTNGELALTYTVHVSEKSSTEPPATTEPEPVSIGSGDVNGDGKVTIADAAAILQYLGNKDRYPLSETGRRSADFDGKAGITTGDAIAIQKYVISAG